MFDKERARSAAAVGGCRHAFTDGVSQEKHATELAEVELPPPSPASPAFQPLRAAAAVVPTCPPDMSSSRWRDEFCRFAWNMFAEVMRHATYYAYMSRGHICIRYAAERCCLPPPHAAKRRLQDTQKAWSHAYRRLLLRHHGERFCAAAARQVEVEEKRHSGCHDTLSIWAVSAARACRRRCHWDEYRGGGVGDEMPACVRQQAREIACCRPFITPFCAKRREAIL